MSSACADSATRTARTQAGTSTIAFSAVTPSDHGSRPGIGPATLVLVVALAWLPSPAAAVDLVAHPSVSSGQLSQVAAKAMFSMRQTRWPDGAQVRVFVLPDGHATHNAFCKEKLNIYPYQLRQIWDKQVYSGTGQAPVEVATEEEMLKSVASTPGAIGYVRKADSNEQVRIITLQ